MLKLSKTHTPAAESLEDHNNSAFEYLLDTSNYHFLSLSSLPKNYLFDLRSKRGRDSSSKVKFGINLRGITNHM